MSASAADAPTEQTLSLTGNPMFMLTKCGKRIFEKPYGVQAIGLAYGFLSGYVRRLPRASDAGLVRFIRSQQLRRLTFRDSIWH